MKSIYRLSSFPVVNLNESCREADPATEKALWKDLEEILVNKWLESGLCIKTINAVYRELKSNPEIFPKNGEVIFDLLLNMRGVGNQTALEVALGLGKMGFHMDIPKKYQEKFDILLQKIMQRP